MRLSLPAGKMQAFNSKGVSMAKELERKYLGVSREELRPVLESLGAEPQGGAHF